MVCTDGQISAMLEYHLWSAINPLPHMTPDGAHLLNAYDAECTYTLNAYDDKLHQG